MKYIRVSVVVIATFAAAPALAGRNSSGSYALPAGNPVMPHTSISSTWANGTLSDVSAALTDSLSRSGLGGMSAPLRLPAGSASGPTLSFTADVNSGWYRAGTGDLRLSITSSDQLQVTSAGVFTNALSPLGATSGGVVLNNPLAGTTDRLASFQAGGSERAYVRGDGRIYTVGLLGTPNSVTSSSSVGWTTASASWVDVTGVSLSITTNGRPVLLMLQPAAGLGGRIVQGNAGSNVGLQVLRGASTVCEWDVGAGAVNTQFAASMHFIDTPVAGTYTYKLQAFSGGGTASVTNVVLVAYEL